jgi:hypothetical protein
MGQPETAAVANETFQISVPAGSNAGSSSSEHLLSGIIAQSTGQRQQAGVSFRRVRKKCQAGNRQKLLQKKNVSMKSGNQAEPRLQEQWNSGEYGCARHFP